MAYGDKDNKKADGFLNLVVLGADGKPMIQDGKEVRLRKGIALDASNRIERSLLNAANADPEFTISLQGAVHVTVDDSTQDDIAFV